MQKDKIKKALIFTILEIVGNYSDRKTEVFKDMGSNEQVRADISQMHFDCADLLHRGYQSHTEIKGEKLLRKMFKDGNSMMLVDIPDDEQFDMIVVDFCDGNSPVIYMESEINW